MVELTCASCETTKEFPSTLTVIDEEIDGWALDIELEDGYIKVTDAYCQSCQSFA